MDGGRPDHLPHPAARVRPGDTDQTGLTAAELDNAPDVAHVMGALDRRFTPGGRYLPVAQHAATEANVIHNAREHCPTLARVDFLDTIPLAKYLVPDLANYKLDTLLAHFAIPQPAGRHRAYADVDVTAKVFLRFLGAADDTAQISGLAALVKVAGRTAKSNIPVQGGLFDI